MGAACPKRDCGFFWLGELDFKAAISRAVRKRSIEFATQPIAMRAMQIDCHFHSEIRFMDATLPPQAKCSKGAINTARNCTFLHSSALSETRGSVGIVCPKPVENPNKSAFSRGSEVCPKRWCPRQDLNLYPDSTLSDSQRLTGPGAAKVQLLLRNRSPWHQVDRHRVFRRWWRIPALAGALCRSRCIRCGWSGQSLRSSLYSRSRSLGLAVEVSIDVLAAAQNDCERHPCKCTFHLVTGHESSRKAKPRKTCPSSISKSRCPFCRLTSSYSGHWRLVELIHSRHGWTAFVLPPPLVLIALCTTR